MTTRREWLLQATAGWAASSSVQGACLTGAVRWIVPNPAGGGYDAYSRLIAPHLERALGVAVRLDYEAGGGGLRGAAILSRAAPDGATIGIVNLPGILLARSWEPQSSVTGALTTLTTVARSSYVWVTSSDSKIHTVDDVAAAARERRLVMGVDTYRDLASLVLTVPSEILGWRAHFIAGYKGSASRAMAVVRGEVDVVALSWEVAVRRIEAGDLRPLLTIEPRIAETQSALDGTASLTGTDGLATRLPARDARLAEDLALFMSAGRVVAAPEGLPPLVESCLSEALCGIVSNPGLAVEAETRGLQLLGDCSGSTRTRAHDAARAAAALVSVAKRALARSRDL